MRNPFMRGQEPKAEVSDAELAELREQAYADTLQISHLDARQIDDLQASLQTASDEEHGSGAHWILIAELSRLGFNTNSTVEAMELAERIIVKWNSK